MDKVKCPQCATVNQPGSSICSNCGTPMPVVDVKPKASSGNADGGAQGAPSGVDFRRGQVVANRYTVQSVIGRGGMGCIYKVHDNTLKETVALKTLLPHFARDKMIVDRFFNEARIARGLSHPNVVRVHDIGISGNIVYISMELIQGKSLRDMLEDLLPGQRLPVVQVLRVFEDLCSALEYAHQYTIHRDIKPENVMIDTKGHVKLMDFGISKLMANSNLTATSIVMGTPHYMSPEQLRNSAKVDARADIYSVGVMLFEVISGTSPTGIFRSASQTSNEVPPALDPIIEKCLNPDPEKRYATAAELRDVLHALRVDLETQASLGSKKPAPVAAAPALFRGPLLGWALMALLALACVAGLWQAESIRAARLDAAGAPRGPLATPVPNDSYEATWERMNRVVDALRSASEDRLIELETADRREGREEGEGRAADARVALELAASKWQLAQQKSQASAAAALEDGWNAIHCYLMPLIWPDGMVFIPPGEVTLEDRAGNRSAVKLDAFFIDQTEVTVDAYRAFMAECGWERWPQAYPETAPGAFPISGVTYFDALAFAACFEKTIPTEAQWARAAYDDSGKARMYPWGDAWDNTDPPANVATNTFSEAGVYEGDVSGFRVYDLYGNVMEWTRTIDRPFPYDPDDGREDILAPTFRTAMIVRGAHNNASPATPLAQRGRMMYEDSSLYLGFRCVKEFPRSLDAVESLIR